MVLIFSLYFLFHVYLAVIQSGRNIRHLPCVVRRSGVEGVCMFAIDCIKANGTHLGTCIDRFYFGSCCKLKVILFFIMCFIETELKELWPQTLKILNIDDSVINQKFCNSFIRMMQTLSKRKLLKIV